MHAFIMSFDLAALILVSQTYQLAVSILVVQQLQDQVAESLQDLGVAQGKVYSCLPSVGLPWAGLPFVGLPFVGPPLVGLPSVGLPLVGLPSGGLPSACLLGVTVAVTS